MPLLAALALLLVLAIVIVAMTWSRPSPRHTFMFDLVKWLGEAQDSAATQQRE